MPFTSSAILAETGIAWRRLLSVIVDANVQGR